VKRRRGDGEIFLNRRGDGDEEGKRGNFVPIFTAIYKLEVFLFFKIKIFGVCIFKKGQKC
jgi:hypothetical protein